MSWSGHPLDDSVRELLEAFFDDDLGAVRLHRGFAARLLTSCLGASAVALGRRLYLSPAAVERLAARGASGVALAAHEMVHVLQYRRYGFFGMLWRYLLDYLRGRRGRLGHHAAYRAIGFEREAWEVARRVGELVAGDAQAVRELAAGGRLPAPTRRRAAELGRELRKRLRSGPSPASSPRGR